MKKIKTAENATATRKAVPGEAGLYVQVGKRRNTYSAMILNKYTPLGHDLEEAKAALAKLLELPMPAGTKTIESMCKDYLKMQWELVKQKAPTALSESTLDDYLDSFEKHIYPTFGQMRPQDFEPTHKAEFLGRSYLSDPPRPIRANRDMAALSSAFAHGMRHGFAKMNPCLGVKRNMEIPRSKPVSRDDIKALMEHAQAKGGSSYLVALIGLVIALTGRRRKEILYLTKNEITEDGFTAKDCKTKPHEPDRFYFIDLSPTLRYLIEQVGTIKRRTPSIYLFANNDGLPYTDAGFKALWNNLMHGAIPGGAKSVEWFTAHDLRSFYISEMYDQERNPNTHKNPETAHRVYDRRRVIKVSALE